MKIIFAKIGQFYRNMPLKSKILFICYVQVLVPMIFIGYNSYVRSSIAIKNKSFSYSQDVLKMIELRIDDLRRDIDSFNLQLLYDNRVYDFLVSSKKRDALKNYSDTIYTRNILRDSVLSRSDIESICIVTNSRNYIYYDFDRSKPSISKRLPYSYIYSKAMKQRGKATWVVYKNKDNVKDIYVARIIYNKDDYKPIGLLALIIKKNFIQSLYNDLSEDFVHNISILSYDNGEILNNKGNNKYISVLRKSKLTKSGEHFIDAKDKILISYVVLKQPHWKIVYHIPFDKLYSDINKLRLDVILIVIWSIVILYAVSRIMAYDIIKPIMKLVHAMRDFEAKGVHRPVTMKRNDEIGYLGNSFNNMSEKIDYLLNMMYKEKLTRKEAELKALQAQINPHFLFNTLENINWMAQLNGVKEISSTVTALANLMEASIGKGDKLIRLEDELKYIDNYVEIIKNRFGDRLVVKKNIDERALNVYIPRLLIQPIIENAISHGIEPVRRNGVIAIKAKVQYNDVIIEISDNGIGMEEKELEEVIKSVETGQISDNKNSVGLSNVNKRIKLFFGEEYGISIKSQYDKYTKITVTIPYEVKGGN
ncbi:sensor histidine kinase [Clostridium oryzae]|uniref:Sensor histidine kinase YpdA n=1 Tax=Clostridium oryzae TaxID=1450648 RepID=A0A1V4INY8_9CLOT|nr:sensor histidine kinase [Clostridium oryzae]OPJ61554.1 sensor histidine kinase YpdA [Clostridium oryzae]